MRESRTGGSSPPVRIFCRTRALGVASAIALAPALAFAPAPAIAQAAQPTGQSTAQAVEEFYRARGGRPLWLAQGSGIAAQQLIEHLDTASVDRLNPRKYRTDDLRRALQAAWGGKASAVQRAERLLSQAFVEYANDLQRLPNPSTYFVEAHLAPRTKPPRVWLDQAAAAPSTERYAAEMGWMNPLYG